MQLMGVRPLKGTASLKTSAAPQHPSAAQPQRSSPDAPDNHGAKDTEEDFQSAMQLMGVRPLKGTTVNHTPRLSPAMPKPMGPQDTEPVVAPSTTEPAEDTAAAHALFLEQWTQTPAPESSSPSLKVRQLKSVKSHHLEFDGELDCHGMTLKEAAQALNAFLHDANQHGDRTVLIITGKGHHSPEGRSPMRTWIRHQLTHDHAVRVEAMADAPRQWGGRGATVVYLRKRST
jgi:DNA-nicking Smr family endonuclease